MRNILQNKGMNIPTHQAFLEMKDEQRISWLNDISVPISFKKDNLIRQSFPEPKMISILADEKVNVDVAAGILGFPDMNLSYSGEIMAHEKMSEKRDARILVSPEMPLPGAVVILTDDSLGTDKLFGVLKNMLQLEDSFSGRVGLIFDLVTGKYESWQYTVAMWTRHHEIDARSVAQLIGEAEETRGINILSHIKENYADAFLKSIAEQS